MPSKLWEKIKLSQNYQTALQQIDDRLIYWPKFLVHKCKQRLTRLTQVAIRMRRLAKEDARLGEKIVPKLAPKIKRREETGSARPRLPPSSSAPSPASSSSASSRTWSASSPPTSTASPSSTSPPLSSAA